MPVDARAFVKPAIAETGVDADHHDVLRAVGKEIGQIEAERGIPVVVAADVAAIDEDERAAKYAVEIQEDATARVTGRNLEGAPVPTDGVPGISAAKRLVTV